jgi:CRP/FNR family transcriptional regulator, cyclic AMP receptor protein
MPPMLRIARLTPALNADAWLGSAEGTSLATYQPRDIIFSQGDGADSVMYLLEGAVKLSVLSRSGKEAVVAMLETGAFFGEGALMRPVRGETATAMIAIRVRIIPSRHMIRLLHERQELSERFIAHMLARNIRIEEDVVDQLFNAADKRLARALILLTHCGTPGATRRVPPGISQQTLADIVGTTRSRVNIFLKKFTKLGYIECNDGLKVNDSLARVILRDERVRTRKFKTG